MNTNLKLSLVAICSAALTAGVLLSLPNGLNKEEVINALESITSDLVVDIEQS